MSLNYEMMKMAAHALLAEGKIYCTAINAEGEPVYVHADKATEADRVFSKKFVAALNAGKFDVDGTGMPQS